ncbi:MAG TPA: hypothetical protein VFX92_05675 [Candidatus Krumholzibacteria bacterium]|nr:hypothetical protein [Candidatus Krumholzibacteria bacterium]
MKRVKVLLAVAAICAFAASSAPAATNLALQGIGLRAGFVNPDNLGSTLGFGLIFDLGTVHPQVAVESYAGFWSQTDSPFGTEFGVKDFSMGGRAKYMFTTSNPTVQPYAGAGLGLHVLNAHVESPAYTFGTEIIPGYSASDTEVRLGLDLGGGLKIDRGTQFAFVGEGWFSVVSDVSHFSVMVGAVYMFGR